MAAIERECSTIKQRSVRNDLMAGKCTTYGFTKEWLMCKEKYCLVKTFGLNIALAVSKRLLMKLRQMQLSRELPNANL